MARITRRFARANSYVTKESCAAILRELAQEIEDSPDKRLVSLKIERRWATPEEVEYNRKREALKE